MTTYDKQDAVMTRGMAILSMLVLHLFCRTGADVYGSPLIWLNDKTPFVYWFGFFGEICVPTYTICAGYAQELMFEKGFLTWHGKLERIFKLLRNYWIILIFICIIFKLIPHNILNSDDIPGSFRKFVKSIFLIHLYTGIWWYLQAYIILLLLPSWLTIKWVNKIPLWMGLVLCYSIDVVWYLLGKLGWIPNIVTSQPWSFIQKQIYNLIDIIPYYWIGLLFCRDKVISYTDIILSKKIKKSYKNVLMILFFLLLFIISNIIHKAVLMGPVAIMTFLAFNLLEKPLFIKKVFLLLGRHSTNIWLLHPFFYAERFGGLVEVVKYPLLILLLLLLICITVSYLVIHIDKLIDYLLKLKKNANYDNNVS